MTDTPAAAGTLVERLREYAADCDEGIVSDYETPGAIAREAADELSAWKILSPKSPAIPTPEYIKSVIDGQSKEIDRLSEVVRAGWYDRDKRIGDLTTQLSACRAELAAVNDGLDFEPDASHSVPDMANVGFSLMEAIAESMPGYSWNQSPAEIVSDLLNRALESERLLAEARRALTMERMCRTLGQEANVHWESLRDLRRESAALTDAALASKDSPK